MGNALITRRGGGKPEGIYIWKKCEYISEQTIVNPTFHIKANVSTQKAAITSDDINFKAFGTLTDSNNFYQSREPEFCNFMNGFNNSNSSVNFAISTSTYSGQLELNYSNNSYWNAFTKMTPTDTGAELTASNLFKTTIDDTLQYTGTKTIAAKIGEFISYIVSDKETAFPDGGEKGGYWYEKVGEGITPEMFGCTKVAIDTATFASDQNFILGGVEYYLPHSLGEIPKHAILWAQTDITTYVYPGYLQGFDVRKNAGLNAYVCVNWLIGSNNSFTGELRAASLTADNVYINGGVFKAGVEYKLITMA